MIRLINRATGTEMWVADNRLEEYLAAGHKLPADQNETKPTEEEPRKKRQSKKR